MQHCKLTLSERLSAAGTIKFNAFQFIFWISFHVITLLVSAGQTQPTSPAAILIFWIRNCHASYICAETLQLYSLTCIFAQVNIATGLLTCIHLCAGRMHYTAQEEVQALELVRCFCLSKMRLPRQLQRQVSTRLNLLGTVDCSCAQLAGHAGPVEHMFSDDWMKERVKTAAEAFGKSCWWYFHDTSDDFDYES